MLMNGTADRWWCEAWEHTAVLWACSTLRGRHIDQKRLSGRDDSVLNLKEGPKIGGWETGKAGPAKQTTYAQGPRGRAALGLRGNCRGQVAEGGAVMKDSPGLAGDSTLMAVGSN